MKTFNIVSKASSPILGLLLVFSSFSTLAQNRSYAQEVIDTLCSPYFFGRGYVKDGDRRAAHFIANQYREIGLDSLNETTFHSFKLNVNSFDGQMGMSDDQGELKVGADFVPNPSSGSCFGTFEPKILTIEDFSSKSICKRSVKRFQKADCVLLSHIESDDEEIKEGVKRFINSFEGKLLIEEKKDLTWSVGRSTKNYGHIWLSSDRILKGRVSVKMDARLQKDYQSQNVIAYLKGREEPDSFIFLTAHYDHLGGIGNEVYIPGANDNASGIAMMLDMAKHYKQQGSKYSLVFIGFGGEEAGLVGSYHFVSELNQWVDPTAIRFVVNMDLMGSGQEGIMAVNGKVFKEEYDLLSSLNDEGQYLSQVKARGKAANSDHYFFTEVGIKAFFFYLMGPYEHYHEIADSSQELRLDEHYDRSFKLIRDFIGALQN